MTRMHGGGTVRAQECTKGFNIKVNLRGYSMLHLTEYLRFHFIEHLKMHKN